MSQIVTDSDVTTISPNPIFLDLKLIVVDLHNVSGMKDRQT